MEADIAIAVAIALVVAFIAGQIGKTLRASAAHKTLREAVSRGVAIDPEMLLDADRNAEPGNNDLRNGMVLIAIALAIAGFGLIQGQEAAIRGTAGIALFPLFVGIALLVRVRFFRTGKDA